jgi:hypothetical protein
MDNADQSTKQHRGKEIYSAIGELLWTDWDPIGVNQAVGARGEYDAYIGPVYCLLATTTFDEELIQYFQKTETGMMGLSPASSKENLRQLIQKLRTIDLHA